MSDARQRATLVAALTFYAAAMNELCDSPQPEEATAGGTLEPLDLDEIDELIGELNHATE